MYELNKVYDLNNFKLSIEQLNYKPLSEVLEGCTEDTQVVDEFRFTLSDEDYMFAVEGYHIDDDTDSYAVSVYDISDDHWLDTYNRVCTAYYDSCGGGELDTELKVFDIKQNRRKDFEEAIETVLFGENGIIIGF